LQIWKIDFRGVPWCYGHKESFGNISWTYCRFEKSTSVVFRHVINFSMKNWPKDGRVRILLDTMMDTFRILLGVPWCSPWRSVVFNF
jgi:hypothetical protein